MIVKFSGILMDCNKQYLEKVLHIPTHLTPNPTCSETNNMHETEIHDTQKMTPSGEGLGSCHFCYVAKRFF